MEALITVVVVEVATHLHSDHTVVQEVAQALTAVNSTQVVLEVTDLEDL